MKILVLAVMALISTSGTLAQTQTKATNTPTKKQNLTASFAKAAFLYVEAVANESSKRDDLLAEMKFAADDNANVTKDFEAVTFLEHMFSLVMDLWNEGARAGMKEMAEKKTACVVQLESELKARNWTGVPESCQVR
jgi:hypothetical protein